MATILQQLDAAFRKAIADAFGFEADPILSASQNDKFGDYQSNAAMGLAKQVAEKTGAKTNPRAVAEQIRSKLDLGASRHRYHHSPLAMTSAQTGRGLPTSTRRESKSLCRNGRLSS